jgi:Mn2+/Fe2+ NRAMP family transporter
MIGGAMLSDGLGLGGKMDSLATKVFTTVALLLGMLVAIFVPAGNRVGLLVFAQAATVIGLPLLAVTMFYLATRPDLVGERAVPLWMKLAALIGMIVVMISAYRLGQKVGQNPWLVNNLVYCLERLGW